MTEHDDERNVSRRYRELPREEPPAHLDEAIRAQARRIGAMRPAPLVPPTGRSSWHYPAAAAAVLVLAVAVTWHVEREQPDSAEAVATGQPAPAAQPEVQAEARIAAGPKAEPSPPLRRDAPARQKKEEPRFVPDAATQDKSEEKRSEAGAAAVPPPSAPQPVPPAAEEAPRALAKQRSAEAAQDAAPEAWLERIAKLRREGRHEEADKALAEFRKRYPDFRIAREMLEQVEKK